MSTVDEFRARFKTIVNNILVKDKTMDLEQALEDNAKLDHVYGEEAVLEQRLVGEIVLPSGKIVACDPFLVYDSEPFDQKVEPGKYPLTLSIAHIGTDQRIVLATIHFSDRKPKSWTTATTPRPGSRRYSHYGNMTLVQGIYDFIVDYGCASYMDAQAASMLTANLEQDQDYMLGLAERMRENHVNTREWAIVCLDPVSGLNIAMFSSGVGDGAYSSYWGTTDDGETVCLTTDFGLVQEPRNEKSNGLTLWAR